MKMLTSNTHAFYKAIVASAALLAVQSGAFAANITWGAAPGTNIFNTGTNWAGGTAPGTTDVAVFGTSTVLNPTVNSAITIQGISITLVTGGYTLDGANLLTVTGSIIPANTSGTNTITNFALGGVGLQTVTQTGGGTLVLSNVSGAGGIVLAGGGPVILQGANTFSGGVTTAGGATLRINSATALGTGTFTFGGGTVDNTSGGAITLTNNNVVSINADTTFTGTNGLNLGTGAATLGTGTGTTRTLTVSASTLTIGGGIANGTTGVNLTKAGAGILALNGNNTFTGIAAVNGGTLQLGGAAGSLLNISGITMASGTTLALDNTGASNNVANRIADSQAFILSGQTFVYRGSDQTATNSSETIGAVSSTLGTNIVTNTFGSTNSANLTLAAFNHSLGQTAVLFNGTNLGANSGTTSVGHTFLTATPTLVGTTAALSTGNGTNGSGLGAAKNTQIIPYLVGEATAAAAGTGTQTGTANTFLTYNATTGLRPLNLTDEYTQNATTAGDNIRITANTAATTANINSLILGSNTLTIGSGITVTVASGAVLGSGGSIAGAAGTLNFGSNEALFFTTSGTTIASQVTTSGGAITKSGTSSLTISGATNVVSGDLLITNANQGLLTLSGALTSTGATNVTLRSNGTGTGGVTMGAMNNQGTITNAGLSSGATVIGGVIGSNVTGINQNSATSSLELSNLGNTFTGPISVISGSTLLVRGDGALGNVANVVTLNSGTLSGNTQAAGATSIAGTRTITLNGGGTFSGPLLINGTVNGTGALTISNTVNLGGTVSNSGALTISGTGILSGNITPASIGGNGRILFSTDANIGGASSTIAFVNSGNVYSVLGNEFNNFGSHTVTFSGGVSGSTTFDIQDRNNIFNYNRINNTSINSDTANTFLKAGQGTVVIGSAQTYANGTGAATALYGGNFIVDSTAGGSLATAGRLAFGGGTFTLLGKTGSSTLQTLNNVHRVDAGGGTIVVDNNGGSSTTTLALGAIATTFNAGSSLNLRTVNLGSGSATITTTSLNANGIIGAGRVTFNGTDFATNTTNLSGGPVGAFTGATAFVGSGATAANNYALTGSGTVTASETVNTLKLTSSGAGQSLTINASQVLTVATGGLLYTGTDNYSITGTGTLKSNTATNSDLIVHQNGSGILTIDSVIATGIGTSTLTKTGTGTLVLTANNATSGYTGATFVNGGLLSISSINNLGAGSLSLIGGGLQTTTGVTLTKNITVGGNGGTVDVGDGQTTTLSGTISNHAASNGSSSGGIIVSSSGAVGSGVLILSGNNTFTGGVEIVKGVLQLGAVGGINSGGANTLSFGNGSTATFRLNGIGAAVSSLNSTNSSALIENASNTAATFTVMNGGTNSYAGNIQNGTGTGALSFAKGGAGTLTLSGTNTYTGGTTVHNGTLVGTTSSLQGAISNNGVVRFDQSTNGTYAGNLSGAGALAKAGSGAVTVSGTNTYSGTTTVSNGTLLVTGTHSGAGAYTVATGGTLGGNGTITTASNAGVTLASGAKLAPGTSPGTLTLALGTGVLDISAAVGGLNTGALLFELGATSGGGVSDLLAITTGVLNIGSGVLEFSDFNFTDLGVAAGTYTLFDTNSAITGTLGSTLTGTIGGLSGTLSFANSNNDLILTVAAVPEPSTYAMVAGGLAALAFLRRRNKKS